MFTVVQLHCTATSKCNWISIISRIRWNGTNWIIISWASSTFFRWSSSCWLWIGNDSADQNQNLKKKNSRKIFNYHSTITWIKSLCTHQRKRGQRIISFFEHKFFWTRNKILITVLDSTVFYSRAQYRLNRSDGRRFILYKIDDNYILSPDWKITFANQLRTIEWK